MSRMAAKPIHETSRNARRGRSAMGDKRWRQRSREGVKPRDQRDALEAVRDLDVRERVSRRDERQATRAGASRANATAMTTETTSLMPCFCKNRGVLGRAGRSRTLRPQLYDPRSSAKHHLFFRGIAAGVVQCSEAAMERLFFAVRVSRDVASALRSISLGLGDPPLASASGSPTSEQAISR